MQALQHSKVKLTWDEDDAQRKQLTKKAFSSQHDIQETELKAYLASDSDSGTEDKAKAADKYRALLGGLTFGGKARSEPAGEIEVTFTSGLAEAADKNGQVLSDDDDDETTIEKYRRKEKERRAARRAKMRAAPSTDAGEKQDVGAEPEPKPESQEEPGGGGDLGFDDPFFDEPAQSNAALRKAEKKKRRQEKAKEAADKASKRAELELLMADDNGSGKKPSHFDMKQIVKAEKQKQRKPRSSSSKGRLAEPDGLQQDFEMDVKDPRFAPVFERHDFAIDPTNPRFVKTEATKKLMDERRKRSAAARAGGGAAPDENDGRERKRNRAGGGRKDELLGLVQSLKRKARA